MKRIGYKKPLLYLLGLTMLGLTVTLIQKTNLGMSSWDALNRNFYEGVPIEYKYLTPIFAFILISFAYLIEWKKPDWLFLFPLFVSFYIGFVIDLLLKVIPSVVDANLAINLLYLLFALTVCAVGLNLIIYCQFPLPALDAFCNALAKRLKLSFGKGKLIGEIIALGLTVIAGLAFHHQEQWFFIGPTTIIFAVTIGLFVDLFKKPIFAILEVKHDNRDLR
ncbi:MAG: DUF6198 family protein [Candidatus Izemoplasmatales bacterium]|jgi:uncharacterized membrane protein YczE